MVYFYAKPLQKHLIKKKRKKECVELQEEMCKLNVDDKRCDCCAWNCGCDDCRTENPVLKTPEKNTKISEPPPAPHKLQKIER
jgi:hypothetical protein